MAQLAAPRSSAYFFDVDGTLLEIKPRPEDVVADAELRDLLSALSRAADGALALVSGRMIDDVDRIFAPLTFPAAGLHGAEIRFPDGSRSRAESDAMNFARPALHRFVAERPGARLEDKGATLAVHFRQRPEIEGEVRAFLAGFATGGLMVQEGKLVAELKQAKYDKGAAIDALLEAPPFAGRRPVFIGDDLTDEKGFRLVNERGGIAVRVGSAEEPTEAGLRLDDPARLRRELKALAASY